MFLFNYALSSKFNPKDKNSVARILYAPTCKACLATIGNYSGIKYHVLGYHFHLPFPLATIGNCR